MMKEAAKLQKDDKNNVEASQVAFSSGRKKLSSSSIAARVSRGDNQKFLAVALLNNVIKKANQGKIF